MADLLLTSDVLVVLLVSLAVGVVVGLTGMGGGALMTPALVFLGIPPTAAVANDLVAAAFNKSVGAAVHTRRGSPDLRLAGLLVSASVPAALLGAWLVGRLGSGDQAQELLRLAIGATLLLTAATYTLRVYGSAFRGWGEGTDRGRPVRVVPTLVVGAVGGFLVGLTSVGSGSIIMISLLLLNPGMSARRLVGTDLVQAVPLVIAAAIGHVLVTGVDWAVLVPLVAGGAPGTFIGARLSTWVPSQAVRRGIVIVLTLTGLSLLRVPPLAVGATGAALLVLGPLGWALLRRAHGLPTPSDEPDPAPPRRQEHPMTAPDDHEIAAAVAEGAGRLLVALREERAELEGSDLKDLGDRSAHELITGLLGEHRPDDAVLSEEGADDLVRLASSRVWIVDPLDGTREFSERPRDDWAVHVALWEDGRLVAGAVALPAREVVFRMDRPAALPPRPDGPVRLAVSRSRPPSFVVGLAERIGAELVPMGSAGVKAMAVLDGTVDAYVHAGGQYEWDSAAPVAVATGYGLAPTRLDGSPLEYNRRDPWLPDLVIARPEVLDEVREALDALG